MSLFNFLFYLAAGRLITWLLQTNGLMRPVWQSHPLLAEMRACDLCLGFWVYLGLALAWPRRIFGLWPHDIERGLLAAITAMVAHLLRLGWLSKFGTVVID